MELEEALAKIKELEAEKSSLADEKAALLKKRDELIGELRDAKSAIEPFKEYKDKANDLLDVYQKYQSGTLVSKDAVTNELEGKYQKMSQDQLKEMREELARLRESVETERTQKKQALIKSEFVNALGGLGAINPNQVLTILQAENRVKMEEENGVPKIVGLYRGEELPPAELAKKLREDKDYQHFFKADFVPGSGTNFGDGGDKPTNPWAKETFNLTKQMQLTRENPTLAAKLKKQAGR